MLHTCEHQHLEWKETAAAQTEARNPINQSPQQSRNNEPIIFNRASLVRLRQTAHQTSVFCMSEPTISFV